MYIIISQDSIYTAVDKATMALSKYYKLLISRPITTASPESLLKELFLLYIQKKLAPLDSSHFSISSSTLCLA